MERKSQSIVLSPEDFGAFWKYIGDGTITDIDYNGSELWVKNIYGEKKIVERDFPMPFLDRFCQGRGQRQRAFYAGRPHP